MVHVAITPEMSAWIAARIDRYAAEAIEPYQQREAPVVAQFAVLPLIRHWVETLGLRADGEVVSWATADHPDPYTGIRPVDDRIDWISALVEGARRYPELRSLLPLREPGSIDCRCVGIPLFSSGKVICPECCGLGWVRRADP